MYQGFKKAMMKTHFEIYIFNNWGNETKNEKWKWNKKIEMAKSKRKLNMLINTYSRQRNIVMQKKCNWEYKKRMYIKREQLFIFQRKATFERSL